MFISQKTEFFPTEDQKKNIEITFGMRRMIFNKYIHILKRKYGNLKENKEKISIKEIMSYRKDIFRSKYKNFLNLIPSTILDSTADDVCYSIKSLWRKGKNIRYKTKKEGDFTFRIERNGVRKDGSSSTFKYKDKMLRIPRIGFLQLAEDLRWEIKPDTIRRVTIKRRLHRYFICITFEIDDLPRKEKLLNSHIGLDWGIKTYLTGYDGDNSFFIDMDNSRLKFFDFRIRKYQKELIRRKVYSKNWYKTKTKLSDTYLKLSNYKNDFINQVVSYFEKEYDFVILEELNMNFAFQNKKISHKVMQKPYYFFKFRLIEKFKMNHKDVFRVPRNYPSTQICSCCGKQKEGKDKIKLQDRIYKCSSCNNQIDRDINAAINIYSVNKLEFEKLIIS